jgi:hypothetical protein
MLKRRKVANKPLSLTARKKIWEAQFGRPKTSKAANKPLSLLGRKNIWEAQFGRPKTYKTSSASKIVFPPKKVEEVEKDKRGTKKVVKTAKRKGEKEKPPHKSTSSGAGLATDRSFKRTPPLPTKEVPLKSVLKKVMAPSRLDGTLNKRTKLVHVNQVRFIISLRN